DVDVPRCFIAMDQDGRLGSLVEFFYGYPDEKHETRFVHASDFLQHFIVNKKRGRPHGFRTNVTICADVAGIPDPELWWGKVIAFDALIGNTDRHPDNWGLLTTSGGASANTFWFAPAYDNGTSLGYQIASCDLKKYNTNASRQRFIDRGEHHCGWDRWDDKRLPHAVACKRFGQQHIGAINAMQSVIRIDMDVVRRVVESYVDVHPALGFTVERSELVSALLQMRRDGIAAALGA
ncbi:MAG: hypothetical protein ACRYG8_12680, partial [Janthinobacterium lividum]